MSSLSSSKANGQPSSNFWQTIAPYTIPAIAGGLAVIPPFYGFIVKSALQTEMPIPKMSFLQILKEGCKAAPTLAAQILLQTIVEKAGRSIYEIADKTPLTLPQRFASAMTVAALSVPALAIFNGQTTGRSAKKSLRHLYIKQAARSRPEKQVFYFYYKL